MKADQVPAFLLHQLKYRETSLILDIFTQSYGRLNLIAKGARNKNSKIIYLLQPFQKLNISWSGKSELMTLTNVELAEGNIKVTGKNIYNGFYVNELLTRLLHKHEAHPELFIEYEKTISAIGMNDQNVENVIRKFELSLLDSIGYGLIMDHDVDNGEKINNEKNYYYKLEHGPTRSEPEQGKYILISGKLLNELEKGRLQDPLLLKESKKFMRFVLNHYLDNRPLSSRSLYQAYLKNTT